MYLMVKLIELMNPLFFKQRHPFNLRNEGIQSYAQWEYDKGEATVALFSKWYDVEQMFHNKVVLDMGCGAGGKSLYYAGLGVEHIVGTDLVGAYVCEAQALAKKLGRQDLFTFIAGDAGRLPLESQTFDVIIMNDVVEHIDKPEAVLAEAFRLLRPGGRIYINFPPYFHPFGAHLSDVINIPWVHLFFGEQTLIKAYKRLVAQLPDAWERTDLRIAKKEGGREYFSYINHMTIRRFRHILKEFAIVPVDYKELPLRWFLRPLTYGPTKEMFVKMVICVLEKGYQKK